MHSYFINHHKYISSSNFFDEDFLHFHPAAIRNILRSTSHHLPLLHFNKYLSLFVHINHFLAGSHLNHLILLRNNKIEKVGPIFYCDYYDYGEFDYFIFIICLFNYYYLKV